MAVSEKKYPRALPHRAPDEVGDEVARLRRRSYWLTAAGVAAVAVAVGAILFAVRENRGAKEPTPSPVAEEVAVLPSPRKLAADLAFSQATETPPRMPAVKPTRTVDAPAKERFLEALGSLCAAHLYQSYLNIGLLADGVESEAYTPDEGLETLLTIGELMDQVEGQLDRLGQGGLEREDAAALEQIRAVTVLLRLQSTSLRSYWATGDAEQAKKYHEVRKAAWKGLTKILQLEAK